MASVVDVVRASGHRRVVWGSFFHAVTVKLARRHAAVPQFFSARECLLLYLYFYLGAAVAAAAATL